MKQNQWLFTGIAGVVALGLTSVVQAQSQEEVTQRAAALIYQITYSKGQFLKPNVETRNHPNGAKSIFPEPQFGESKRTTLFIGDFPRTSKARSIHIQVTNSKR